MEELPRMLKRATTPTLKMYATVWQCIHIHPVTRGMLVGLVASGTLKVLLAMYVYQLKLK